MPTMKDLKGVLHVLVILCAYINCYMFKRLSIFDN